MSITKKLLLLFISIYTASFGQFSDPANAQGVFLTVGVGPRFPIGDFGNQQSVGAGFDAMISFTDNELAPVFFYLNIGYQNHPGDYDYYKVTDLSSISTNIVSFNAGSRFFFSPLIEDMILLMPIVEGGITYAYVEKYQQYKIDSGRNDKLRALSQFGFHVGAGLSFFLMDVIASYNYLQSNQYFSVNLRLTIPLAITI